MDYASYALEIAEKLGADYADIRIQNTHSEEIFLRNLSLKDTSNSIVHGYGIRILKNGGWGFAHSNRFDTETLEKTVRKALEIAVQSGRVKSDGISLAPENSYIDSFETRVEIDPFSISLTEKVDMMLEVNRTLMNYEAIKQAMFHIISQNDLKTFANTEGSRIEMNTTFVSPMLIATAVANEDSQSRAYNLGGKNAGWEYVNGMNFLENADRVAREAIMKCHADTLGEPQRRSLLLDPIHLGLTMHESVGHPTELDRVLGWEADFAGVSFATPEKLKNYRYGSDIVNLVADNRLEGGLATMGYDDDGVPGQRWHIIEKGILNEYGTTRETAPIIGLKRSRGCNRATYYYDFPINRIPNLYLAPGKTPLTPQELIADTEDGVLIEGQGSFSIDQHRVNFQFGGDLFYEIKNGKKTRMLKKILYKSNNPEFWTSCDAICDKRFFKTFGVNNCGKGQPMQAGRMTHGASLTRFRNIRVGGSQ
ncbi:MAG: TldD/PmbA family protein [Candidatus Cloacimonetes bacterium]|nr:TldD/PmbA family protein [Candidatus Cloacimonadota bacterium]